jgi:hypothetical protein
MKGVRTNRLARKQVAKAEKGLSETLRGFQDMPWKCFEGAYERCLHEIRLHYMRAACRDLAYLYGPWNIVTIEEMARISDANEKAKRRQEML